MSDETTRLLYDARMIFRGLGASAALILLVALTSIGGARAAPPAPEVESRTITGSVVSILPGGSNTIVIINRGTLQGVSMGDTVTFPFGRCRIVEVWTYRLKCLIDGANHPWADKRAAKITIQALAPDAPRELAARVTHVRPEEGPRVSLLVDKGWIDGVRLGDEGASGDARCRVWSVRTDSAWCVTDAARERWDTITITRSGIAGRALEGRLVEHGSAPTAPPDPAPGVRAPAPVMQVVRVRGDGLVPSHRCLGFTPAMDALYLVAQHPYDPPRSASAIEDPGAESGLVVTRVDLALLAAREILHLHAERPLEAAARLEALRAEHALVACHTARQGRHDIDGPGPLRELYGARADHGSGVVYLWQPDPDDVIRAATGSDGADVRDLATVAPYPQESPTAAPYYPGLGEVYFSPPSPLHVTTIGREWRVFELAPR
ncbi:MAG: hypothetical protein IT385_21285 [Deltaproteobacteria bacterium]|nr:hypothetical protein [Deltaproteobacteria bacterium]